MLVLSRLKNEKVILTVGDVEIVVAVAEIGNRKVRLAFTAPPEVTIHREEVRDRIIVEGPRK